VIVVDAKVFLRTLTQPATAADIPRAESARRLFADIQGRRELAFACEAVVAEVAFILTSPRHYGVPRREAAEALIRLIRLPGLHVPEKTTVLAGLRLWAAHAQLDFPDALVVAYARAAGARLASFDADVRRLAAVPLWEP
jgi:predicted nucleic acid-binding protein